MTTATEVNAKASGTFAIGGDLIVNRLGYGAMRITGDGIWGEPADRENAKKVLRRAVELGVNFIDTADSYGPEVSEQLIGEALAPYAGGGRDRDQGRTDAAGAKPVAAGWPSRISNPAGGDEPPKVEDGADRPVAVASHRSQGAGGRVSRRDKKTTGTGKDPARWPERGQAARDRSGAQGRRNRQRAEPIQHRRPQHEDVVEYCTKHKLAFIPWFPVAAGKLAQPGGKLDAAAKAHGATVSQLSLAWLLHHSPVILPIPGTSSVEHLEENVGAASVKLTDAEWKEIEASAK
jgi:pyridoxine 4-dehydrogenase